MSTIETEILIDGLRRDLERLDEAYMVNDVEQARRVTTRMILNLRDLYTDRPGCLMRLSDLEEPS